MKADNTTHVNLAELEFEFATFRGRIAYLSSEASDQFTSLAMFDNDVDEVIDILAFEIDERQLDFDNVTDLESFLLA